MLTKTLSEAKKKQRSILIKAMNNDIGSIDSAKDSWNPAQISERAKDISYIRSIVDTWNPAQLNEALRMLDLPVIDTWNPAQIEEQRRNLVFYLAEKTLTGNPITVKILGNLTLEVTGLKVSMSPIQDLHGYSNPWAGGAGKNKAPTADFTITRGTVETFSPNLSAGTYSISFNATRTGSDSRASSCRLIYDDDTNYEFSFIPSGAVEKENITATKPIKSLYMYSIGGSYSDSGDFTLTITDFQIESGATVTAFSPYENICPISGRTEVSVTRTAGEDVETKTHEYSETIYGGVDDFVNGGLTNEWGYIASYDGETLPGEWISDRDVYAPDTTPSTGAEVAYRLETPTTISTTAEEITLLKGTNVLSTDGDSIELKYKQNF